MKKLGFLIVLSLFLLAACSKEESCAPLPATEQDPRAEIVRIAMEGAAMLDRDAATRAAVGRRVRLDGISCRTKSSTRAEGGTDTLYYVVNFEDDAGFALVAADDRLGDRLLAVTEQGSYAAGEITDCEGFNAYMAFLDRDLILDTIRRLDSLREEFAEYHKEDFYSDWTSKGPYVTVKWGQGSVPYDDNFPYNKFCYINTSQGVTFCPAGCVTVAIGQIMSYHKKPSNYKITYDGSKRMCNIDWSLLSSCSGGIGFSWSYQNITAPALATLFREIGKRASMTYTPEGSSATILGARESFAGFGYDQNPQCAYTYGLVKSEIDAGRPLMMVGGADGVDKNGNPVKFWHAWVVDGYKERYHYLREYFEYSDGRRDYHRNESTLYAYVHINWGYDGRNNGYFTGRAFDLADAYEYDSDWYNWLGGCYQYQLELVTGIWNDKE